MLSSDRNTPYKQGELIVAPVAAATVVYAGALVVVNADGYAEPGSTATGLAYLGRADDAADNSAGADGDQGVPVRRGLAFKWENSAGDPVTQASLGRACYIEDDETVSATDGGGTQSIAGTVIQIDEDGIWVE
ncbi:hypothetical protein BN2364_1072 [Alloalcanivorax xenomutans]|uniref:hypothetical protein n=1 Tax=Alloalcanivorax xenomutans TaxID=1094342 RepID=UPI0006D5BD51|nr:hypothetical protein [Alloalcanivorax xenomutans]CUR45513.1 hypothetical protein BN2364_1072 [Alloalcanivorax xenomutans]